MDVIGLDLSLTSTGIATPLGEQTISTKLRGAERLVAVRNTIMEIVREFESPYVVLEGYSFASRSGQAFSIGELGGVVRAALHEDFIPYVEVPPTVRAKFATGRGNAGKGEVISAISAKTGRVFQGGGADDLVDAWVLREMGLLAFGESEFEWPAKNLEAMEKIDWI